MGPFACGGNGQPTGSPGGSDNGSSGGNASSGGSSGSGGASSGGASGDDNGVGGTSGGGTSGGGASSSSGAGAGDGGAGSSSGSSSGDGSAPLHTGKGCLQPGSGDYSMKGPYTVTKSSVDLASYLSGQATPTTYSLFTPSPLDASCPAPVVVWGNGTTVTGSSTMTPAGACTGTTPYDCLSGTYDFFNVFAASWGIVVIASDNSNVGSGAYHKAGADYMMAQNKDSSSPFYQKLSGRIGVSGHSQGGIGATAATTMIGAACEAEVCVAGGGVPLHSTAFICLTGTADQAESGCKMAYGSAGTPAFLADWDGGTHTGTETLSGYTSGDKGTYAMMKLYAAWFRCFLADDAAACKLFEGGTPSGCGMCKDPGWADLESRGL
ncbi:MAG TPA: hypothetical protein VHV30_12100 [Polyangiaceae bacterium]|nr:hypothetical protein [Polyangiaceae bacterium]